MKPTSKLLKKIYVDSDLTSPEVLLLTSGNVAAFCGRCPGSEETNDDCAGVIETDRGVVLIVADGVGGGPMGHKASATAVESIIKQVLQSASDDLRAAILDGIEIANGEILEMEIGAATTLAVVEIQDSVSRAYHVGDSQTLIVGQRGSIKWKSTPHSPVGYAVESGMLDEVDAMYHEHRHYVSNLVGSRTMHIEIGPSQPLAARDTIIVGSDGLYDNVHMDEVVQLGRIGKPLDRTTNLVKLARERMMQDDASQPGKPDDLTVLLFTK